MKLSKRLLQIYNFIDQRYIVADIGCDHGLLSAKLILDDKAIKVYACDINEKPLERAKILINNLKLNEKIIPILSDGIEKVPEDVECVIIAGMGFDTIKNIIINELERFKNMKKIIVQANSDIYKIRKFLLDNNFEILEESVVEEEHFYQIISFRYNFDCDNSCIYTSKQVILGVKMTKNDDYYKMLEYYYSKYLKIKNNININNKRYKEIEFFIDIISEELKKN